MRGGCVIEEGQRLQQIVRRGKHGSVRVRRAMIIMASASGTLVPAIARLVAADEDTVRGCDPPVQPEGPGGAGPSVAEAVPARSVTTIFRSSSRRPGPGQKSWASRSPWWSLRKLATHSADGARPVRIGRERLRQLCTPAASPSSGPWTWKESTDPDRDAKLDRIEYVTRQYPDRCFAFDQFGPLSIRPATGPAGRGASTRCGCAPIITAPIGIRYFHWLLLPGR